MKALLFKVIVLALLLTSCSQAAQPTLTALPAPTDTPAPTSTPTLPPTPSPTPDPYAPYTIDYLRSRKYGGGQLEVVQDAGQNRRLHAHPDPLSQ